MRGKFIENGADVGGGPLGGGIDETIAGGIPGGNGTLEAPCPTIGGGNLELMNAPGGLIGLPCDM